jgi:chromosome segregation ATPase
LKQLARLAASRQELLDNIEHLEEQNKNLQRHLMSSAEQVRQVEEEVARLEEAKHALMEAVEAEAKRVKEVEERERRLQLLHDGLESEIRCVQAEHTNTLAEHEVSQAQLHAANSCLQRTSQANEQLNQAAEQLKQALQSCQSKVLRHLQRSKTTCMWDSVCAFQRYGARVHDSISIYYSANRNVAF